MATEEIFGNVETAINLKIPQDLKSMLVINGYVDAQLLADISEQDLVEIETFAKKRLLDLIPKHEYEKYYGIFKEKPESYEILSGHRKIIYKIAKHFKDTTHGTASSNASGCDQSTTCGTISDGPPRNQPQETSRITERTTEKCHRKIEEKVEKQGPSTINFSIDLTEENRCIFKAIKSYIKSKCTSTEEWADYHEKCHGLTITTKLDGDSNLVSDIKCFCERSTRIQKKAKNLNCQSRWIYSNFHRHFATHMRNDRTQQSRQSHNAKNPEEMKKGVTIQDYFKPREPNTPSQNADPDPGCSSDRSVTNVKVLSNIILRPSQNFDSQLRNSPEDTPENIEEDFEDSRVIDFSKGTNNSCCTDASPEAPSSFENPEQKQSLQKFREKIPRTKLRYQRSERKRRRREKKENGQQLITKFYSIIVTEVKNVISDHPELESELLQNLSPDKEINNSNLDSNRLLELLYKIATQNENRGSNKNLFNPTIKRFALYIYYIGGRLLYETLHANLTNALPSISSLHRFAKQEKKSCEEGVFDYAGLDEFLIKRGQKKIVWISEDATRITGKIEYDPKGNKIVGFVLPLTNGIPVTETFIATSANAIQEYFRVGTKAHYVYTVMAQPLSENAPSFCLTLFGTDNKFTFEDIQNRWVSMRQSLEKFGIQVMGFSSDGDTRLLKAMRLNSGLPVTNQNDTSKTSSKTTNSSLMSGQVNEPSEKKYDEEKAQLNNWKWYQIRCDDGEDDPVCYVQDAVHILTKMRVRLLKPAASLRMGNCIAGSNHLQALVRDFSKDQHLLTITDLKGEDKMNFEAAEKMCSLKVMEILEKEVPGSEATILYLRLMRYVIDAYLNKKTTVENRIYCMWYCIFFLRIWRDWLKKHKYTIMNNFVSSNAYISIELSGHSLIKFIIKSRQNEDITNDMFLPWLFSSQSCEKLFRTTRSMSSTFSTVVNFSVKDILHRIDRIQAINNILIDCSGSFKFPREDKRMKANKMEYDMPGHDFRLSDQEIENIVERALKQSLEDAETLEMRATDKCWNFVNVMSSQKTPKKTSKNVRADTDPVENSYECGKESEDEESGEDNNCEVSRTKNALNEESADVDDERNSEVEAEESHELRLDLCNITLNATGTNLQLRDYSEEKSSLLLERGSFVRVTTDNGKSTVIRKSSLCWLLDQSKERVSADRLRRFIRNQPKTRSQLPGAIERLEIKNQIMTGDWCLFEHELSTSTNADKCVVDGCLLGRILSFSYSESSDESNAYCADSASVKSGGEKIRCTCTWYSTNDEGVLTVMSAGNKEVCDIYRYKCSIPSSSILVYEENGQLCIKISCDTMTALKRRFCVAESSKGKKSTRPKLNKKIKTAKSEDASETSEEDDDIVVFDDSTDTEEFSSNLSVDELEVDEFPERKSGGSVEEECMDYEEDVQVQRETQPETALKRFHDVSVGNFVVCSFIYNKGGKKEKQKKFISEVINKDNFSVTVSCMRYNEKTNSYSFPNVKDEMSIHVDQISDQIDCILSDPIVSRGKYKFSEVSKNITQ